MQKIRVLLNNKKVLFFLAPGKFSQFLYLLLRYPSVENALSIKKMYGLYHDRSWLGLQKVVDRVDVIWILVQIEVEVVILKLFRILLEVSDNHNSVPKFFGHTGAYIIHNWAGSQVVTSFFSGLLSKNLLRQNQMIQAIPIFEVFKKISQ